MVEELGPPREQSATDKQHLGLLSVFHFVGAGLGGLGVIFLGLHYVLMSSVMHKAAALNTTAEVPPDAFFDIFRWFYLVMGTWLGSSCVLNLLAGLYLRARKHRRFCIVVAALNCLHMPFGTILGIFTIVVLVRDSVRTMFAPRSYGVED